MVSAFALSTEVAAQRKIITSKEYYEGISMPSVKYYDKSRHVETTDETIANGVATESVFTISEVLLPGHTRVYVKTTNGDKINEFEQITIDFMQYTRKDNGAWTKVDLRQSGFGSGSGNGYGYGSSQQCTQYSVESTSINGRPLQLFEWLFIDNFRDELLFHERRTWIGHLCVGIWIFLVRCRQCIG